MKRLNHEVNVHGSGAARAGLERDKMERRLKLATEEIVRVRLAYDDPDLDATDGAHPAWWRGCDHGVRKAAEQWRRGQDEIDMLTGVMTPDEWWYRNRAARGEAGKNKGE